MVSRRLNEEMARIAGNSPQPLTIGASTGVGGYALPCSIYLFKEKYPEDDVGLVVGNSDEILQKLEDWQLRIGRLPAGGERPADNPTIDKGLPIRQLAIYN